MRFDAVIAVQDAAIDLVESTRHDLFPGAPLIFFATSPVSGPLENATGLVVGLNFGATLPFIADLQPRRAPGLRRHRRGQADREYQTLARSQLRPFESRFRSRI